MVLYIWTPSRKIFSFKYSLWSWSRMGVRFMGENPIAGRPIYNTHIHSI